MVPSLCTYSSDPRCRPLCEIEMQPEPFLIRVAQWRPQPLRAEDQENRGNHIRQKERNKICLRLAPSHETQTSEGATTEGPESCRRAPSIGKMNSCNFWCS